MFWLKNLLDFNSDGIYIVLFAIKLIETNQMWRGFHNKLTAFLIWIKNNYSHNIAFS